MEWAEAAKIVDVIRESIQSAPGQFKIEVHVSGQHIESHGGTGLHASAVASAPGATAIGNHASLNAGDFKLKQQCASQFVDQQYGAIIDKLEEIAGEMRSPKPDASLLSQLGSHLKTNWIPNVIASVVANLVTLCMLP